MTNFNTVKDIGMVQGEMHAYRYVTICSYTLIRPNALFKVLLSSVYRSVCLCDQMCTGTWMGQKRVTDLL